MVNPNLLKRIPFFEGLDDEELRCLAEVVSERRFLKQDILFHEGDPVENFYFIEAGLVKVYTITDDGREQTINLLRPGEIFPHVGFLDGGNYPAYALAMKDTRMLTIHRAQFLDNLIRNGRLSVQVLKAMGKRLTALQLRIKHLTHRSLNDRVALVLLHLAEEHGVNGQEGVTIDLPITHQELANLIGGARESVTRVLTDMRRSGIVSADKRGRLVIDRPSLLNRCTQP